MITEIGIAAGDIWHHLDKNGQCTLKELEKAIGKPRDVLLMSLGWLAREGHIQLSNSKSGYVASLKDSKSSV